MMVIVTHLAHGVQSGHHLYCSLVVVVVATAIVVVVLSSHYYE